MRSSFSRLLPLLLLLVTCGCSGPSPAPAPARPPGDAAFTDVAKAYLEDTYQRQPALATLLGIHKYDDRLGDPSQQAIAAEVAALRAFR